MLDNSNCEIFFDLVNKIREGYSDIDILMEFGGGSMYVPSFKKNFRNIEIARDYNKGLSLEMLARKYQLSKRRIQTIVNVYKKSLKC